MPLHPIASLGLSPLQRVSALRRLAFFGRPDRSCPLHSAAGEPPVDSFSFRVLTRPDLRPP